MAQEDKNKKKKRPTAEKRMIQNKKAQMRNRSFKSRVKTAIRGLREAVQEKDQEKAKEKLQLIYSLMDKGVKNKLFKLNQASRTKSRLTKLVQSIA